jgi:hypothetical protein
MTSDPTFTAQAANYNVVATAIEFYCPQHAGM